MILKGKKWINNTRHRFVTFVGLEIIFLTIFAVLIGTAQATEEESRVKLQQAVDKSYIEEDKVGLENLKSNIKKDISTAKVVDEDAKQFPVQTVVDGYEFKVEENGNIESVKNENSDDENQNLNNTNSQVNNIISNEINDENKTVIDEEGASIKETLVKYKNDEKTAFGITISTNEDGVVKINGKSTKKLFIKISNNIQITDRIEDFIKWKEEEGILIPANKKIKQKVTILNNPVTQGQVNVVLRTENNEATAIIKLAENQTEYTSTLQENIIANYVYIDENVQIDNTEFKVEITEEK